MKNLILPLLFSMALLFSPSINADEGPMVVQLIIDAKTTAYDIQSMQDFMEANGYELIIEEVEYNFDGRVQKIKGRAIFGDQTGAFEVSNLKNMMVEIKKDLFGKVKIEVKESKC